MAEELSKRIDDVHKRFDDLRADMVARFAAVDKRLDDMNRTFRMFMWVVSGWFMFLTAVLAVFGFLRR